MPFGVVRPIDFFTTKNEQVLTIACIVLLMGTDIYLSSSLHSLEGGRVEEAGRFHSGRTCVAMSDNPQHARAGRVVRYSVTDHLGRTPNEWASRRKAFMKIVEAQRNTDFRAVGSYRA